MLDSEYGDLGLSRDIAAERVETYVERTVALEPDNALAIAVRAFNREIEARSGRARHDISSIVKDLHRALEIDPKNSSARNWLGISYGEIGDLEAALAQFSQCAEDDPYYAPCVENIYDTMAAMGRMDDALDAYLSALGRGAVTDEWTNFRLLAHFGMEAHFLFAANQSAYLPGWRRHDELWAAWQDLDADHTALARDIRAYADQWLDLSDNANHLMSLVIPLGGSFDLGPLSIMIWAPEYAKYRRSDTFRQRIAWMYIDDYWREHGFPPQCRPIGDEDFECQ